MVTGHEKEKPAFSADAHLPTHSWCCPGGVRHDLFTAYSVSVEQISMPSLAYVEQWQVARQKAFFRWKSRLQVPTCRLKIDVYVSQ